MCTAGTGARCSNRHGRDLGFWMGRWRANERTCAVRGSLFALVSPFRAQRMPLNGCSVQRADRKPRSAISCRSCAHLKCWDLRHGRGEHPVVRHGATSFASLQRSTSILDIPADPKTRPSERDGSVQVRLTSVFPSRSVAKVCSFTVVPADTSTSYGSMIDIHLDSSALILHTTRPLTQPPLHPARARRQLDPRPARHP